LEECALLLGVPKPREEFTSRLLILTADVATEIPTLAVVKQPFDADFNPSRGIFSNDMSRRFAAM